jgi:hypothetical protein
VERTENGQWLLKGDPPRELEELEEGVIPDASQN